MIPAEEIFICKSAIIQTTKTDYCFTIDLMHRYNNISHTQNCKEVCLNLFQRRLNQITSYLFKASAEPRLSLDNCNEENPKETHYTMWQVQLIYHFTDSNRYPLRLEKNECH